MSDVASCPLLWRAPPFGSNIARCFNPKKHAHFMNLYHALSAKFLDTYDFAAAVSQCSEDIPWHWVSQRPQSPHHQMLNRPVHLPVHHLWHGASESEGMKSAKIVLPLFPMLISIYWCPLQAYKLSNAQRLRCHTMKTQGTDA